MCIGEIPLPVASIIIISIFFSSILWARVTLCNQISTQPSFRSMSPFLAGEEQTEFQTFCTLVKVFLCGLCEDVWASGNAGAWGKGLRSCRAWCTLVATGQVTHALLAGNPPGNRGPWLQTEEFVSVGNTSLEFLLFYFLLFLRTSGEQNQPSIRWWKGFCGHLTLPQHAAGKQNPCWSETIQKQKIFFSVLNLWGIAINANKTEASCLLPKKHSLSQWKRQGQLG